MIALFMMYLIFSFSLTGVVMKMAPGGRGGRRGRGSRRNRAMKIKHVLNTDNSVIAEKHDDWVLMAPANGIINKIECRWEAAETDIESSASPDAYFGLFWTRGEFNPATARFPLGTNFDGTPKDAMDVHLGFPQMMPLYFKDTSSVSQAGEAQVTTVIRMKAGEVLTIRASQFDILDEQSTKSVVYNVTVYFSMETELSKYQDTVPVTVLCGKTDQEAFRWMPPCYGKMYNLNALIFSDSRTTASTRATIGFNTEANYAIDADYWIEVTPGSRSFDMLLDVAFGTSLYVSEIFAGDKGVIIRRDCEQSGFFPLVLTGYFAPLPGSDWMWNYNGSVTTKEFIPFPVLLQDMAVSVAWTTATAGDEIVRISHYDSDFIDSSSLGTAYLYESRERLFSYIVAATTGQDREDVNDIDRPMGFGDIIYFEIDSDVDNCRVIMKGQVPKHNYGIRKCVNYLKSPYLREAGDHE